MSDLALELAEGGGPDAPPELAARLRGLLEAELARGVAELRKTRSGYGDPICVALAATSGAAIAAEGLGLEPGEGALLAICPAAPELRADPGAVTERTGVVVAAAVQALVEAVGPGPASDSRALRLRAGSFAGWLALAYPARGPDELAELAALGLGELLEPVDRLRCQALALPGHVVEEAGDWREPIGPTHPLRVAEAVTRLGGSPLDEDTLELHEETLARLLEPPGAAARAHQDPYPARRMARRILQRLDGMGKWGGYHTEFVHLARGFGPGNERALALEIGEALLREGLLAEKTSVGQRHVFLNPRRSGEIRALIDEGRVPEGLRLPAS